VTKTFSWISLFIFAVLLLPLAGCKRGAHAPSADQVAINRGRRFVTIMGCNDCHTPGYSESGGNLPESQWLTGTSVGWHGPWGTTYAANLRRLVQGMSQDDWIKKLRGGQMRPPMPGYAFRTLQDEELGYMYAYIKSLGATGDEAPAYLPPGKMPPAPYVDFVMPAQTGKK
jgi:mono/diheme cytochrome c family protein